MTTSPSFETGTIYKTFSIAKAIANNPSFGEFVVKCLARHQLGDWGDLEEYDRNLNEEALIAGDRIFSAYTCPSNKFDEDKIWIITESDRSATTILFPFEY